MQHNADLRAQRLQVDHAHVVPIDQHAPAGGVVKARDEIDQAGFAAAGGADQGDDLVGPGCEGQVVQRRAAVAVGKGDVLEAHLAHQRGQRLGLGRGLYVFRLVKDFVDACAAGHSLAHGLNGKPQALHRGG